MYLSQAIANAKSVGQVSEIFAIREVKIFLNCMSDTVTVEGYEGSVTTDFIAQKIMNSFFSIEIEKESKRLASLLTEKIFIPLKHMVECRRSRWYFYQLTALTRASWMSPQSSEFGSSIALKHAMALGFLDEKYRNNW
jgi:hypothetical protein